MVHIIALSLLLFFAAACGNSTSNQNMDPFEKIVTTSFSNEPLTLTKQSPSYCQRKNFEESDSRFLMHLFIGGNQQSIPADFLKLLQGNFLRDGEIISRSIYGEKVELIPTIGGTRSYIRATAKDINLCPEESGYEADTIEGAALSSSFYIKKTYENFKKAVSDVAVGPITLTISPLIIRSTVGRDQTGQQMKYSSYMTDNAVYFPAEDTIAFLPMSRELRDSGVQMKFWEVPMVASHEYGHHLFKSIYGPQGTTLSHHICFESPSEATSDLRRVTNNDVLTAINEGFADLISFYTLDAEERSVKGLTCLEVTRDVDSPIMVNGKRKELSSYALASYFSYLPDYSAGCHNPSYQENHVLGAIIAHNVDAFLSHITDSNEDKLRAVVSWIRFLKRQQEPLAKLNPRELLNKAMQGFFSESTQYLNRPWDKKLCQEARNIYPEITQDQCND